MVPSSPFFSTFSWPLPLPLPFPLEGAEPAPPPPAFSPPNYSFHLFISSSVIILKIGAGSPIS
mgnify:CR=1 FL=1